MGTNGPKGSPNAEQTSEYLLVGKLGERFPRLRQTLLDLFSIDLRTLALTRVMFALIVLVELMSRLSDLRAFYSDDGVMPRAAVYENLPRSWFISLHFLSGRAEVEALMFVISGAFALLLLLGYKTRLVTFWTWLLFSSLCIRNPFIVHGGDNLLKMLLFLGIFVPWGARYSVDSALNTTPRALPKSVFSIGTIALLLQMPLVYFFSGILKNGLEWRHDFTAILYALKVPDFALPLGTWLTSYPGFLKVLTASTLVLEMAGALLLFCPFRTKTVRCFVIVAFFFMQLGLALTLTLGLFPLVSTAALLPFVTSSFWDRRFSRLRTSDRTDLRIYYDGNCGFCTKGLKLIKTFFLLPDTKAIAAQSDPAIHEDMIQHNSWVVIDSKGNKHFKFQALLEVLRVSPLLWPIVPILRLGWIKSFGTWIYDRVANNRGWLSRLMAGLRYRRLNVRMPLLLTVFCALCLIYVVVDNFGSVARSPIRIPARVAAVGQLLNLRQNWRLFAPTPLRVHTWYVVEGRLRDGRSVDVWTGQPVTWEKPANPQPWINNIRWRAYMRYLTHERQRSLRPYFASYVCRSWNESHPASEGLEEVTVFSLDEPISLDGSPKEIRKTLLWQQVCELRKEGSANTVSR
jgi:predicted DCC family thiol-disulfide oxidoreductase YuxK